MSSLAQWGRRRRLAARFDPLISLAGFLLSPRNFILFSARFSL